MGALYCPPAGLVTSCTVVPSVGCGRWVLATTSGNCIARAVQDASNEPLRGAMILVAWSPA